MSAEPMHLMTIEMGAWCGASGPGNGRASSQWREVTCPDCAAKGTAGLRSLAWDMLGTMGPGREALAFAVRAGRLGVTDEQGRPLAMACAPGSSVTAGSDDHGNPELQELTGRHDDLLHEILRHAGFDPCDVQDPEDAAACYVRDLEAERDRLAKRLSSYERITTAWTRGMYSARIDCVRGDTKAAIECLAEGLDGYDGPEWNGTETGAEWWERTKAEEGL